MSLHATPSPEVLARLHAQRRNATVSSVVIATLSVTLAGVLLGLFLIPSLYTEAPMVVIYDPGTPVKPDPPAPTVPLRSELKPAAPAHSMNRVITANSASAVAVPSIDVEITTPSMEFGDGVSFGEGWTDGTGAGPGGGGGFGSTERSSGGLEGTLYDFKQKPGGGEIRYNTGDPAEFVDRALKLQRSRFSDSALRRHFRAPNSLFLTHLAIPNSNASEGPSFFGAKDSIKPSGWLAHYRGKVTVPRTGTYRFSGLGDDYLVVLVNSRMRLAACWGDIHPAIAGRWDATEPTGNFPSFMDGGMRLVYGDWIPLKAGEVIDLDIAIGERPGGKVGFILHIEEKNVQYRTDSNGRPILPLFATAPFSEEEKSRLISTFGTYQIEWDNIPVFPVR